jgi:glycosyltransferase involved in cell wall biosynthesis
MSPVVSVVMPAFDNAAFLPAAIESILGQSFGDLELIVVDDGSSDGSSDIVRDFARRDRRVRLIVLPRDPSLVSGARAANIGIAAAQGEFIARMDSDDISLPERLALQLRHMDTHGLDICGGQAVMFGAEDKPMWYPETHAGIRNELFFRSGLLNPTLLVRGDLMREARYGEADAFEEYEFQTRMWFNAKTGNLPQVVHRFRGHPHNTTVVHGPKKTESRWQLRFRYFFRHYPEASLDDFRAVHKIAWSAPFETMTDVERAGHWLLRLSRVDEPRLREQMARRWARTCRQATVSDPALPGLQKDYAGRILAAPETPDIASVP